MLCRLSRGERRTDASRKFRRTQTRGDAKQLPASDSRVKRDKVSRHQRTFEGNMAEIIRVPDGYVVVGYGSPKKNDLYLGVLGVTHAEADHKPLAFYPILRKLALGQAPAPAIQQPSIDHSAQGVVSFAAAAGADSGGVEIEPRPGNVADMLAGTVEGYRVALAEAKECIHELGEAAKSHKGNIESAMRLVDAANIEIATLKKKMAQARDILV